MTVYAFPQAVHVDADNVPAQAFTWSWVYPSTDLTGYTATMTIDGIAVNLPCTVTVTTLGVNVTSVITLTTVPGTTTGTWLPGVYGYRVTLTAPDATTGIPAYGNLLELSPRQGTVYGTTGPQGPAGPSAITTLTANFTQPASMANVQIAVASTLAMAAGASILIGTGGYYQVVSVDSPLLATVTNLGAAGNAAPTTVITKPQVVTIAGVQGQTGPLGPQGPAPVTTVTTNFTQPAGGATVSVVVGSTAPWSAGSVVYISGGGDYVVSSVTDSTHFVLINLDTPGGAQVGATVSSGSVVTTSGLPGLATSLTATTTNATPATVVFDFTWMAPLTTFRVDVVVNGRSTADDVAFILSGLFRKASNGNVTQTSSVQLPAGLLSSAGGAAWTGALSVSGSTVVLSVTGGSSVTVTWSAVAQVTRVTGPT